MYNDTQKKAVVQIIKDHLVDYPNYEPNQINEYQRLTFDRIDEVFFDDNGYPAFTNEEMRKLDLSKINFIGKKINGVDFSYTNIDVNSLFLASRTNLTDDKPKTTYLYNLSHINFEGLSLGVLPLYNNWLCIEGSCFKNTGAKIDIRKCVENGTSDLSNAVLSLKYADLEGLYFHGQIFNGVNIEGTNLTDTEAYINLCNSPYSQDTILKGCKVLQSSIIAERVSKDFLRGCEIEYDMSGIKYDIDEQLRIQKRKVLGS